MSLVGNPERPAMRVSGWYPDERAAAARDMEAIAQRLRSNSSRVKLYGSNEDDAEWPATEPPPADLIEAIDAASQAVHAVDVAITKARLSYRKRVLEWLLAEAELEFGVTAHTERDQP